MPVLRGTYAIVLASHTLGPVRIGKLGSLPVQSGFYVYIGSAFGPGGLQARIQHHLQRARRPHWHLDYLRAACDVVEVWFATDAARLEHRWAGAMAALPGAGVPMPGFGASDCDCVAHLFSYTRLPSIRAFRRRAESSVSRWIVSEAARRSGQRP